MTFKPDLPPELLAAARSLARSSSRSLSRRGFIQGTAATGAAVAGRGLLAACGTPDRQGAVGEPVGPGQVRHRQAGQLRNWPSYIDVDDKIATTHPTLDAFKKQTGIKVNYVEDINDNDDVLRQDPAAAEGRPGHRPRPDRA